MNVREIEGGEGREKERGYRRQFTGRVLSYSANLLLTGMKSTEMRNLISKYCR